MGAILLKVTLVLALSFSLALGKSVLSKKKDQATIDKEVLLEDEDYDDDVLDLPVEEQKSRLQNLVEKKIDINKDGYVVMFILLQPLRWRCVDCVIHHERDVRKEQQYI